MDKIFELYVKYALKCLKPIDSCIPCAALWGRVSRCLAYADTEAGGEEVSAPIARGWQSAELRFTPSDHSESGSRLTSLPRTFLLLW